MVDSKGGGDHIVSGDLDAGVILSVIEKYTISWIHIHKINPYQISTWHLYALHDKSEELSNVM